MQKTKDLFQEADLKKIFSNKELLEDYADSLMNTLTNVEQGILYYLLSKRRAVTKSTLRSFFINKFYSVVCVQWIKLHPESVQNQREKQILSTPFFPDWHPELTISPHLIDQVSNEIEKEIESEMNKKKGIVTETRRLGLVSKAFAKYKINLPSINVISSSLKSLKKMGLVNFRIVDSLNPEKQQKAKAKDNEGSYQRELWFVNPMYEVYLKKIYKEDKEIIEE